MQNVTTQRERVELRGMEKFTNYSVQVLAYTQAGDGVRSSVLYIQTKEDGESGGAKLPLCPQEHTPHTPYLLPASIPGARQEQDPILSHVPLNPGRMGSGLELVDMLWDAGTFAQLSPPYHSAL